MVEDVGISSVTVCLSSSWRALRRRNACSDGYRRVGWLPLRTHNTATEEEGQPCCVVASTPTTWRISSWVRDRRWSACTALWEISGYGHRYWDRCRDDAMYLL